MARILQICNSDFNLTHFLTPLVRELVAQGHEVECVCDGAEFDMSSLGPGVVVRHLVLPRSNSPSDFLLAITRMRDVIREGRFDCVNSHNRSASIVARVAAWLEHVPVNLYTAHGYYFHDDQGWLAHEASVWLEAALVPITSHTLSQSREDAELMIRRRFLRSDQIDVIGNGIDTVRFAPVNAERRQQIETALGLRSGCFRVVSTGRLVRAKGFTDLLDAFAGFHAAHPEAELVIVGGRVRRDWEPYSASFLARRNKLGLSQAVKVTGIVARVEDYLAASDVFVLASYREGVPRALLEAMSMALPVAVTDIRGCRQAISDGVNGRLFPAHDVARLATILDELFGDPVRRRELGQAARRSALAHFDEKDYVARQVSVITRLLSPSGCISATPGRSKETRDSA